MGAFFHGVLTFVAGESSPCCDMYWKNDAHIDSK